MDKESTVKAIKEALCEFFNDDLNEENLDRKIRDLLSLYADSVLLRERQKTSIS